MLWMEVEEEGAMACKEVMYKESQAQTQCLGEERGKTQGISA